MGDDLISTLYNTVLNTAPMYLLKVAALALEGRYPNGDQVLQEGRDAIILAAVERTAGYLVERFGTVDPNA